MRIAVAQLNYKIGDFDNNAKKIEQVMADVASQCDLIVFSELCLSGYYPYDLITRPAFYETQQRVLKRIQQLTLEKKVDVIVGVVTPTKEKSKLFHNSLVWISQGNIIYTYDKRLLPVYNIFNEARHFSPGKHPGVFSHGQHRFGFLICEDAWANAGDYIYDCNPVEAIRSYQPDCIICINGSPSNIDKEEARFQQFQTIAKTCHAPLLFINQIGGNDDIVFDGNSFVLDQEGAVLGKLPAFKEDVGIVTCQKRSITLDDHFLPHTPLSHTALFYHQTLLGLQDYVKKCGFQSVVVGASGGMDSTLTLALAVQALGKESVTAMAMPSRYSSAGSLDDAKTLCHHLGIPLHLFSIEEELEIALRRFAEVFHTPPLAITEQNIQARLRGRLLMEFSNQTGALVLSTGNKSELSVGYTTLYGDMAGGLNVIGDLYKTDVYALAHYFNQQHPDMPIPHTIFEKPPSAELALDQKDSDTLPPYEILDAILKLYLEGDLLSLQERHINAQVLKSVDPALIHAVHQMVDHAEFKRRQSAPIIRVQRRAFGIGHQFPIAANKVFS